MDVNEAGLNLIKQFESLKLEPYNCPAGHATIGYGRLIHVGPVTPADCKMFDGYTEANALSDLLEEVNEKATAIRSAIYPRLNSNQFSACVSFAYNLGAEAFKRSTLLKRINAGRYEDVPAEFMKWSMANGRILQGLLNRRKAEVDLWSTPV